MRRFLTDKAFSILVPDRVMVGLRSFFAVRYFRQVASRLQGFKILQRDYQEKKERLFNI